MTADEIRAEFATATKKPNMTAEALHAACLCELAAQLAELNEKLKSVIEPPREMPGQAVERALGQPVQMTRPFIRTSR